MANNELYQDNLRDTHWLGEVVDNIDPDKLGRCRVRVFGKFDLLEIESIPWATPMNRIMTGSWHVPNIGEVVSIRFDNGNIYHPEYGFQINNTELFNNDITSSIENPEEIVSLVYDQKRNVRIYRHPVDGIIIASCNPEGSGEMSDGKPMLRLSEEGEIFLYASNVYIATEDQGDTQQPAVRGKSLEKFLQEFIDDYKIHTHPTGVGPSGTLINPTKATALGTKHIDYQQESKTSGSD